MSNLEKSLLVILLIIVLTYAYCDITKEQPKHQPIIKKDSRIKLVELTNFGGYTYRIISVDGIEFFVSGHGGVFPLDSINNQN